MVPDRLKPFGRWIVSCGQFFGGTSWPWNRSAAALDPSQVGAAGERLAARYLKRQGYRILARGYRQRLGEIDLVALDGRTVVFIEVKTWTGPTDEDPSLAVDRRKQERLTRAALIYLKGRGLLEQPTRFDVVSIVWPQQAGGQPKLRHFQSAFEAAGRSRQLFH